MVTKGALVTAQQVEALTTIQTLDPIYVDIACPADRFSEIRARLISDEEASAKYVVQLLDAGQARG